MYNGFCKLAYKKKNILGDFIMKNTVKLEQFVELTEVEMQEIQGGDMRISESIRNLIFPRKKK